MLSTIVAFCFIALLLVNVVAVFQYGRVVRYLVNVRSRLMRNRIQADWGRLATGESSDINLERAWLKAAQEMFNLFVTKNHDYGPQNLAIGGFKGIVLRIGDKISRLWQLSGLTGQVDAKVSDESIKDSIMDVANYAIVGYLMQTGGWPTELPDYVFGRAAAVKAFSDVLGALTEEEQGRLWAYVEHGMLDASVTATDDTV